jgi:hypothetical protein
MDCRMPLLANVIPNDDDPLPLGLISLPVSLGNSYRLPPGAPAERVAALRAAFAATAADEALLEEAAAI